MSNGKLIIAIMFSKKEIYDKALKELIKRFGEIDKEGDEFNFDKFTSYYEKEMGKDLRKKFVVFNKIINKKDLVNIKLLTTEIENKYSKDSKRMINLDPGFLSNKELILASFKAKPFKEYLGKKVYAHIVLRFENDNVATFWHTFMDYKEKKKFFADLALKYFIF
jgi:hypothetical protein